MNKKSIQNVLISSGHTIWTVAAFLLASVVVVLPLALLAPSLYDTFLESSLGALVLSAAVYVLAAVLAVLPLIVRKTSWASFFEKLGLRTGISPKLIGWALLLWAAYFTTSLMINVALYYLNIPGLNLEERQDVGFENLVHGYEYLAAFVALVIVAPIFEEIMFRGYLFGRLQARHTFWVSAVVTSLVFALVHMQLNVGIDVFVLSMFMCVAREKFQSIYPTIIMHMVKNGVAYAILFGAPLLGINLV